MSDMSPRFEGSAFILPVRVYYEDTDAGGVVFYANYLKFAERARTEMLRQLGIENPDMQDRHGIAFVVRHIDVEYLNPARLDDLLDVHVNLTKVGGATINGTQVIRLDGVDLVRMTIRLGCMKLSGGPGRLPEDVRERLKALVEKNDDSGNNNK